MPKKSRAWSQENLSITISFIEPYEETRLHWFLLGLLLAIFALTFGFDEFGRAYGYPRLAEIGQWLLLTGLLSNKVFDGEVWRVFTSGFLHLNEYHIFANGLLLLVASYILRSIFVGRAWLWIFLVSQFVGAIATVIFVPEQHSVGGSIGLAGMFGAMLTSEILRRREKLSRLEYPAMMVVSLKGLILVMLLQAVIENLLPNVSHVAHLCGLAVGLVMGYVFPRNGKQLVVASDRSKVRAFFGTPVKERASVVAYPEVELCMRSDFDSKVDAVAFVNVTRGGLFGRAPRVEKIVGEFSAEDIAAGRYDVLGTQYPPIKVWEKLEAQAKVRARAERVKNLPWTVLGIVLGLAGAYYIFNSWYSNVVLDVSGWNFLKDLPPVLQPNATYVASHIGAFLMSFMMAHTVASFSLHFLREFVRGVSKGGDRTT